MKRSSHNRPIPHLFALCTSIGLVCACAMADPMPIARRTAGIIVSDITLDKLYLVRDLNGDGEANDAGEATVFFDGTNAAGFPTPAGTIFALYQRSDGTVFAPDSDTHQIYALRDLNRDGDALDAGEATIFFSQSNLSLIPILTPNGIGEDAAGAIYFTSNNSPTPDAIYRLIDLNGDGDADDVGESTTWCDISALFGNFGPFGMSFIGNTCHWADFRGSLTNAILRATDSDNSGSITLSEVTEFYIDAAFTAPVSFTAVTDGSAIYVSDSSGGQMQDVYRLVDSDLSGSINSASEAVMVWAESNLSLLVPPAAMANSFDITIGPSRLAISSNGSDAVDEIILATDLNTDGDFNDAGETSILIDGVNSGQAFPDNIRALLFYGQPCPADINNSGSITVQDIFDFLGFYFANDPRGNFNGIGGISVQDIFDFLTAYFAGC